MPPRRRGRGRHRGGGQGHGQVDAALPVGDGGRGRARGRGLNAGDLDVQAEAAVVVAAGGHGAGRGGGGRGRGHGGGGVPDGGRGAGGRGQVGGRGYDAGGGEGLGADHGGGDEAQVGGQGGADQAQVAGEGRGRHQARRRVVLEDSDYEEPPPPEDTDLLAALQRFRDFELEAARWKEERALPRQHSVENIPDLSIDSELQEADLNAFYRASEVFFSNNYPMSVEVDLPDGTQINIAVTPEKEKSEEERTHHTITIRRRADRAVGKFLIENYSGYSVAFEAHIEPEEEVVGAEEGEEAAGGEEEGVEAAGGEEAAEADNAVKWCVFGEEELAARFGKTKRIKYGPSYTKYLKFVDMYDGFGSKLLDLMLSFFPTDDNPEGNFDQAPTVQGHILLETSFVVFCEARRFAQLERWVMYVQGRITKPYIDIFQDYLSLSAAGFKLYLYIFWRNVKHRWVVVIWLLLQTVQSNLQYHGGKIDKCISVTLKYCFLRQLHLARSRELLLSVDLLVLS